MEAAVFRPLPVDIPESVVYAEAVGEGPVVVFEAGMASSRNVWGAVVGELADEFTCVLYDRRGLGRSPESGRTRTIANLVDDLAAVVAAIGALKLAAPRTGLARQPSPRAATSSPQGRHISSR